MNRLINFFKSNFLTGLIISAPIIAIIWFLIFLLETLFINIPSLLPHFLQPVNLLELKNWSAITLINFATTIIFVSLVLSFISTVGWGSKKFLGQKILETIHEFIERIPVLRSIYNTIETLSKTFTKDSKQNFRGVRLIDYPSKGIKTIAFITGEIIIQEEKHFTMFVPTTPNPTSGFFIIVKESDTHDCPYTTEDAFKAILSLGMIGPKNEK